MSQAVLSFIQSVSNIKMGLLNNLETWGNSVPLNQKSENRRIRVLAEEGIRRFTEEFDQVIKKDVWLEKGVSSELYNLEKKTGYKFFFSEESQKKFKEFLMQRSCNNEPSKF